MAYAKTWVVAKAAEKAVGLSPCKGCEDRYPACAGHCERYKSWKQKLAEVREQMFKSERGERDIVAYQRIRTERLIKNHDMEDTKWNRPKDRHYR